MSETLGTAARNVRILLNDLDASDYAIRSERMAHLIIEQAQVLGARAGFGQTWVAGAFTLSVGSTADYSLPAVQYSQVLELRVPSLGYNLEAVTMAEIDRLRTGLQSTAGPGGDPAFYALYEDVDQLVYVRLDCIPGTARAVDLFKASVPSTAYTAATTLPFSDLLLRTIEKATALECFAVMSAEQRSKRFLNDDAKSRWTTAVEVGVGQELVRKNRLQAAIDPWTVGYR